MYFSPKTAHLSIPRQTYVEWVGACPGIGDMSLKNRLQDNTKTNKGAADTLVVTQAHRQCRQQPQEPLRKAQFFLMQQTSRLLELPQLRTPAEGPPQPLEPPDCIG